MKPPEKGIITRSKNISPNLLNQLGFRENDSIGIILREAF